MLYEKDFLIFLFVSHIPPLVEKRTGNVAALSTFSPIVTQMAQSIDMAVFD